MSAPGPLPTFLAQAASIIAVSRLLGLGARRVQQPLVIAEITAGIVLGPSLLGWVSPSTMAALFPATSMPLLGMMSQAGLLLFMFLVGLELDPALLSSRVGSSVAISQSSIVVPFALGGGLAIYLHPRLAPPNTPLLSFVLFVGVAMSVTAFPVLARILVERRLLKTRVGAVTIACAAVDDVTAWCVLAVVVSIVRSTGMTSAVRTVALSIANIAVMVFVVRPYLARLANRSRQGLNQNLVALIVVFVFLSSLVTESIGIHALFGAFLLGAVLPKHGSLAAALAEKIEDVVVVVLLPLFFAYSGLRTQLGLLDSASAWGMCLVITLVACIGKFGGGAIAARVTGMPWRDASAIGILMNTRGLMELIVLNIGLDLGVISPKLFAMMVIMALATTFMTTPLLELVYPRATLAGEIAEQEEPLSQPTPSARRQEAGTIVCVPLDSASHGLVTLAAALAGTGRPEAKVYFLQLVTHALRSSFVLDQQRESGAIPLHDDNAAVAAQANERGLRLRFLSFVSTSPTSDICAVAEVKHADLVLLGTSKRIVGEAVLTGTAHEVMSAAEADVVVFVDRGLDDVRRILLLHDDGPHARAALHLAARMARKVATHLTVLHVVSPEAKLDEHATSEAIRAELLGQAPASFALEVSVVPTSSPIDAAAARARDVGLLIVGVGRTFGLEPRAFRLQAEPLLTKVEVSIAIVRGGAQDAARAQSFHPSDIPIAPRFSTLPPPAS